MNVGDEVDGLLGREPLDRPQHLQLRLDVETVAALDLRRRRPAREHLGEPRRVVAATRSSSDAARVARTVETMPPPSAAISA